MASNTDKIEIFIMSSTKLSQRTCRLMAVEWSVRIFHLMNKNTFEQVKLAGAARAFINWRIRISIRVTCLTLTKIQSTKYNLRHVVSEHSASLQTGRHGGAHGDTNMRWRWLKSWWSRNRGNWAILQGQYSSKIYPHT